MLNFAALNLSPLGMSLITINDAMLRWGEAHQELFPRKYGDNPSR